MFAVLVARYPNELKLKHTKASADLESFSYPSVVFFCKSS
jgi:hypothetical protein